MQQANLNKWWIDDPADPGRLTLQDADVDRLAQRISPGASAVDLGGTMSLNVKIEPDNLVLRIHQAFVSRQRLSAVQRIRSHCAAQGLVTTEPLYRNNQSMFRFRNRWAELETYLPHERLAPTADAYLWMFEAMGVLHLALERFEHPVPRPVVSTYAAPSTLRRWLATAESKVRDDADALVIVRRLRDQLQALNRQWVYAPELPVQLVHGDVRLSNVCKGTDGRDVYFDFGFAAYRPRIHDVAYAIAFMLLALGRHKEPESDAWTLIGELISRYEEAARTTLTASERKALLPYTAAVPLYQIVIAGLMNDTGGELRGKLHFLRLGELLLKHPDAIRC